MFNFEKLEVWEKSPSLARALNPQTKPFPDGERFGLISQIRHAALSLAANIAEACSRRSQADYRRFLEIATGSTFGLIPQTRSAQAQGLLAAEAYNPLYSAALAIVRMPSGLRDSLRD
jgi:four helix bundle protein